METTRLLRHPTPVHWLPQGSDPSQFNGLFSQILPRERSAAAVERDRHTHSLIHLVRERGDKSAKQKKPTIARICLRQGNSEVEEKNRQDNPVKAHLPQAKGTHERRKPLQELDHPLQTSLWSSILKLAKGGSKGRHLTYRLYAPTGNIQQRNPRWPYDPFDVDFWKWVQLDETDSTEHRRDGAFPLTKSLGPLFHRSPLKHWTKSWDLARWVVDYNIFYGLKDGEYIYAPSQHQESDSTSPWPSQPSAPQLKLSPSSDKMRQNLDGMNRRMTSVGSGQGIFAINMVPKNNWENEMRG